VVLVEGVRELGLPGFVATPLTREVSSDPVRSAALAARTHMSRNGKPSDFAGVAVFLASSASDYVTGTTVFVDGGFSATWATSIPRATSGPGERPVITKD
jgi:NAD(P)-dependent dehydrogenase (short-subunit alcohol dehydrogenase family)